MGLLSFFSYLGIWIMIWLSAGFLVGLKIIFIDKSFDEEFKIKAKEYLEENPHEKELVEQMLEIVSNKKLLLTFFSLLGFISFILDTKFTFQKKKKNKTYKKHKGE